MALNYEHSLYINNIISQSEAFKQSRARGRDDIVADKGLLIFTSLSMIIKPEFHLVGTSCLTFNGGKLICN